MFTKTYKLKIRDIHDRMLSDKTFGEGAFYFVDYMLLMYGDIHVFTKKELKSCILEYLSLQNMYNASMCLDLLRFLNRLTFLTGLTNWYNETVVKLIIDKSKN